MLDKDTAPAGRDKINADSGFSKKLVLCWVNQPDLLRIKDTGKKTTDMREKGGVDTVPGLAQRKAATLLRMRFPSMKKNWSGACHTRQWLKDGWSRAKLLSEK